MAGMGIETAQPRPVRRVRHLIIEVRYAAPATEQYVACLCGWRGLPNQYDWHRSKRREHRQEAST